MTVDGRAPESAEDSQHEKVVEQLCGALHVAAGDWGALLGLDVQVMLSQRVDAVAERLVAALRTPGERDSTAADLLRLLNEPGEHDPSWWTTPLGGVVAVALDEPPGLTHDQAAAMLGVTRGTIAQWVARGTLTRLPGGGGVGIHSVLDRLGTRPSTR